MLTLPAFYHSSTIVCVDDDRLFLDAISNLLSPDYQIKTFSDPEHCFSFFNGHISPFSKMSFLRGCVEHDLYDTVNHSLVDFNVPALHQLKNFPEKNQEISVVIADYRMPEMNGIDFCRSLSTSPVKKILLTGEVDHRDAVSAFNENIIDRFMRKESPTLGSDIQAYVASLTQQYFLERTRSLVSHLEADHDVPLSDPVFIKFFKDWCRAHGVKEYFLIDKQGSFCLINQDSQISYLVLHTDQTLNSFIKMNEDVDDAEGLRSLIRKREKIPFFGVGKESWQFESNTWSQYLYLPDILEGRERYYWTIVGAETSGI